MAKKLVKGFRPPYENNTLARIAYQQADIGDYDGATATLGEMEPEESRVLGQDLVLAAQARRGDLPPAAALAKVTGAGSYVYEAVIDAQLAAKDHKAAAETMMIAKRDWVHSDIPTRIVDGFLVAGDVDGAAGVAERMAGPKSARPPGRVAGAQLYGHIAEKRFAGGDRPGYQTFMAKAVEFALQLVDMPRNSSAGWPRKAQVLGELAQIQAAAKDFDGAKKTLALIDAADDQEDRWPYERELRAHELAATGRLEEARTWVASLPDAEDRAMASRIVAVYLTPKSKQP